ncbi:MAG: thioredoxin reductase, partial [Acidobacteriota bacterium]|nr:thioredoxin reductase [Acidobacteriota bacterium]
VGGGPAGLSAALHLAWQDRRVVLVDRATGPLFYTLEKLYNIPGMPEATGVEIQKRLKIQARERGAEIVFGSVQKITGESGDFLLSGAKGEEWRAKTVLLATGVARFHPTVDGDFTPCFAYAGKGNLYYCTDCEGPEIVGKETVVIGAGPAEWAATLALGLTRYTPHIRVLATGEDTAISPHRAEQLAERGIPVLKGEIKALVGLRHELKALELADGTRIDAQAFFVSSPARGRTDLATQLGVELAPGGEHVKPRSQRGDTNVPGIWVAGDLRPITQQVAVAMGTGNLAAVMIDQFLRRQDVLGTPARVPGLERETSTRRAT